MLPTYSSLDILSFTFIIEWFLNSNIRGDGNLIQSFKQHTLYALSLIENMTEIIIFHIVKATNSTSNGFSFIL
jgi:hypothetical protein